MLKGELFSTDMVRAYLDGRKKHTCRPICCKYNNTHIKWHTDKYGKRLVEMQNDVEGETFWKNPDGTTTHKLLACRELNPKHRPGDYMYCRETWRDIRNPDETERRFIYLADGRKYGHIIPEDVKWRPSIHMPREAARLFFHVPKVEVMHLEDVTEQFAQEDGFLPQGSISALQRFRYFWTQTYGPYTNWMWVYWTEPCSKEEALQGEKGGAG